MKRLIALIIAILLIFSSCVSISDGNKKETQESETVTHDVTEILEGSIEPQYSNWGDEEFLAHVEDQVYANLVQNLNFDKYYIDSVNAIYISQEYIDELDYNSKENLFFGFSLSQVDDYFKEKKYVFTLGSDNQTIVKEMEAISEKELQDAIIKNVAIGAGVIIVAVVVAVVTDGVGAPPAVVAISSASASGAISFATSGATIGGITKGALTLYQTQDVNEAMKEAALASSEGFKYGAIAGVIYGGASEAISLGLATQSGLTMNEVALIQKESGLPLDLIKQFKSLEEYTIYKNAGLYTRMVNGKIALVRDIDLDYVTELGGKKITNLTRMQKGYAPIDPLTGKAYQLHHINQNMNGTLAILTEAEHQGNSAILNTFGRKSEIIRPEFATIRKEFWKNYAMMYGG